MKRDALDRPAEITEAELLAHLARATRPVSIREIAGALELRHHGRRVLPKLISKLRRRGEIEEVHGGKYRLVGRRHASVPAKPAEAHAAIASASPRKPASDPNLISGRVVAHRDGYGFVVPDEPVPNLEGDLFIPPDAMGDAMHGDQVLARIERRRSESRGLRPRGAGLMGRARAEGRIVRILVREHPTVVGLFRYGAQGNVVLPYDARLLHEIFIPSGAELTPALREKLGLASHETPKASRRPRVPELDGAVVNVEVTRFPKGGMPPAGRVVEILGRPGEIGVDVEIMIRKHHLPHEFSLEALAEAHAIPQRVSEEQIAGRRDFRHVPIVTIDGETAQDFDDAVFVMRLANGRWQLQVHIADVAHYVRVGSALDRDARLRGTSVYFPNRAVPMLPEELSHGICSLNPKLDRLVMSVLIELDESGRITAAEFAPGVIRSVERMTYTAVNAILEGDAETTRRYAHIAAEFHKMKDLALALNARRMARGSIDFDLPEPVIEFDEQGRMTSIFRSERNIAHRIIEEFMLAGNETVGRYLERRAIASLHRVHEKPDPKKVLEFEELAHAFGYTLGVENLFERRVAVRHGAQKSAARSGRMRAMSVTLPALQDFQISPRHYQRLAEKIAGKPEERIVSYLMLRSLRQARYAAEPLGHFALAADEYTHFTSPIRRYPDLIVHRALKWALEHPETKPAAAAAAERGPYRLAELDAIALESSEAERRADTAERELVEWKTAQFMESHLGEEYDALIISVQKFGFFVELLELFVEGLVGMDRIEEFTGQRCMYREHDHAIVSARGRSAFHLGDRVRVRADRIDPIRKRVEFSLVRAGTASGAHAARRSS